MLVNGKELNLKENIGRIILLSLMVLTVGFIFTQSLLSRETSGEESAAVSGWLSNIFPTSTALGAFIFDNIRKIAHFIEFGILGTEFSLYALLYSKEKIKGLLCVLPASFCVAFLDETLQIFSGRGPSIADVWLDFFGALTFSAICFTFYFLALKLTLKLSKKRKE